MSLGEQDPLLTRGSGRGDLRRPNTRKAVPIRAVFHIDLGSGP